LRYATLSHPAKPARSTKTDPAFPPGNAGSGGYRDGAAYCVSSLRMILPPAADHGLEGLGVARHRDGLLEDRERRTSG